MSTMRTVVHRNRSGAILALLCAALLPAGCRTADPAATVTPSPRPDESALVDGAAGDGGLGLHAQWRRPVASGVRVLEVFIENRTASTLRFERFQLGDGPWLAAATGAPRPELLWWQFYPSPEVGPGGAAALTLCLPEPPAGALSLRLDAGGAEFGPIAAPDYRHPAHAITAIAFDPGGGTLYVQARGPNAVVADLWVNGRRAADFRRLRDGRRGLPETLALRCRPAFRTGEPVYVKVRFRDGHETAALARALPGLVRDVFFPGSDGRSALLADERPAVQMLRHVAGDVGCHDVRAGRPGAVAGGLIAERLAAFAGGDERLASIHYCTAMQTQTWDIYGALADAVYANPFCYLSFSGSGEDFLALEAYYLERAAQSARPRPLLWIPEVYKGADRYLTAQELRVLFWLALARGIRGVCYFAYDFGDIGLNRAPELLAEAQAWSRALGRHAGALAALLPVEDFDSPCGAWQVSVAWGGDRGLLVAWRRAGGDPAQSAAAEAPPSAITVRLPEWFRFARAVDLPTDRETPVAAAADARVLEIPADPGALGGGLWLESRPPAPPPMMSRVNS